MNSKGRSMLGATVSVAALAGILMAGCSKSEAPSDNSSDAGQPVSGSPGPSGQPGPGGGTGGPGGGPGGPGGRMGNRMGGRGGRRFEPVAANATAPQIFQQKCQGCHGDHGQGGRGPALTKEGSRSNADLHKIIHDGHEKMPSFAKQMTDAQIDAVVAYVKQLGAGAPPQK